MISQGGKKILEKFVTTAKNLLMQNVTEQLQQFYGIWADGTLVPVEKLAIQDTEIVHTARMLRERLMHLIDALPDEKEEKNRLAVEQLIAEQAFTQLNRFAALRMCEERDLIFDSIKGGYESAGFQSYDAVAHSLEQTQYVRYRWYIQSLFDELSIELPSIFDRFSPYGLIFPTEKALLELLKLINDTQLSEWYDEQNGTTVNFWREDETLGWMFQDYNSLEERRKMREESNKPRNSREMAVRNQFFTPEYIVRFLTDNSLGRIWYEMTKGKSIIGEEQCKYMVRRPDEEIPERKMKEPTEIRSLDPTCGSMHFGLYLYEVYEYIYMDAWDNYPNVLIPYREIHTRESFQKEVPRLILENNIYGCEIDPRALQIAALSLWLRAQRSYSDLGIDPLERPLITKSNLVLAESMPGNKKLLKGLMEELDAPTQRLIKKIWDKMKFVGEAGLLFKMEKEIEDEIEKLKKDWSKINKHVELEIFDSEETKAHKLEETQKRLALQKAEAKEAFFDQIQERLHEALVKLTDKLSEDEGYENALFSEDATRGMAFIALCQMRFDCIVMNPPFGEGSENTSTYLDNNYPAWCKNLVCAFFDRMQEMLVKKGKLGAIFDRTVLKNSSYEAFRIKNICGYIAQCADTGWGVLDANVETSTLVINKNTSENDGCFLDLLEQAPHFKNNQLTYYINGIHEGGIFRNVYFLKSTDFRSLPNSIIGYYFDENIRKYFKNLNVEKRGIIARQGHACIGDWQYRIFYELTNTQDYYHLFGGSEYSLFYIPYNDLVAWKKDGEIVNAHKSFRNSSALYQKKKGIAFGRRGDMLDAQILKEGFIFNSVGLAFPDLDRNKTTAGLSLINSILNQFIINLYAGQHKQAGYMNLLPMPDYDSRQSDIENIVNAIIAIKRHWFSLDETNIEYHGLISQIDIKDTISEALEVMQSRITEDYNTYQDLVKQNDDLWMDLAIIDQNSEFRQTLNDYKSRRPYEELLSIDGASSQNIINKNVLAQEILMELVGMAFGRWDCSYACGEKNIPEWGDVFDALPFMPEVSLDKVPDEYGIEIPSDGILTNNSNATDSLAHKVREVMQYIWGEKADAFEYELRTIIGFDSLQEYFEKPSGFFEYHFKRYTKSRRKAPIYWPLSSDNGSITYWVYYPCFDKNTLPKLVVKLRELEENIKSAINDAINAGNKATETDLRDNLQQANAMRNEISTILGKGYVPNHDDGVPVTAAPLTNLFRHKAWNTECADNLKELNKGEYDWSHLAMSMFPARVTDKAKKDWCMALTHGLEEICQNKPKEKKPRKAKKNDGQTTLNL